MATSKTKKKSSASTDADPAPMPGTVEGPYSVFSVLAASDGHDLEVQDFLNTQAAEGNRLLAAYPSTGNSCRTILITGPELIKSAEAAVAPNGESK